VEIHFKLYASLSRYLPAELQGNGLDVEVPDDSTPHDVLDCHGVPREQAHLVLLNGVYIQPADRDKPVIKPGDTLAVWPPVAGG
jgi:sulfur-carrier protein